MSKILNTFDNQRKLKTENRVRMCYAILSRRYCRYCIEQRKQRSWFEFN